MLATGKSSDELLKASGVINAQAIQVVETRVQGILEKLSQLLDRLKVVESSLASAVRLALSLSLPSRALTRLVPRSLASTTRV